MMLDWPKLIRLSPEEQFKVGIKATLILDSRLCGSLHSPRDVVYSASIIPACFHNVGLGADEQAVQTSNFQLFEVMTTLTQ